jgi:hypothetical protein
MALQPFGPRLLFQFLNPVHSWYEGSLGRGVGLLQGRYLHTEQHRHRINAQTSMLRVGIRNHDPSVRAGEDGSCFRPRGHCDWPRDNTFSSKNNIVRNVA